MPHTKKLFVSSTISDLKHERAELKLFLESLPTDIQIKCLLSETPDFPVSPVDIELRRSTYEICIKNVLESDYIIQILDRRYGIPDYPWKDENISIAHAEYRTARSKRKPVFSFVHRKTFASYQAHARGEPQSYVSAAELGVFALLKEIIGKEPSWLGFWETIDDIKGYFQANFLSFDDSIFVGEKPGDGREVEVEQTYTKTWTIKNNGMIRWEGRYLKEYNDNSSLVPERTMVPIPTTQPGDSVSITVTLTAGDRPCGEAISAWKMTDDKGRLLFPSKLPLRDKVKIVY